MRSESSPLQNMADVEGLTMGDMKENFGHPNPGCGPDRQEPCNLMAFGNYCNRTQKERVDEARARMDNRIFFMGITAHGYQQPVREAINPRFRDMSVGKPEIEQFLPKRGDPDIDYARLSEDFRSIDVYSGLVDGRNYGRYNRLHHQKLRHTRNPLGTEKRFCIPICNSMNTGWWIRDIDELNCNKWYAPRERFPQVRGEVTKFVDDMAMHDPGFMLF